MVPLSLPHKLLLLLSAGLLAGCGGGSSNTPTPTLSLTLSAAKATPGDSVTVAWQASDAATCEASGAWSGAQALMGTLAFSPSQGGRYRWVLRCQGAGGHTEQAVELVVPMPVYPSSYQNAKHITLDEPSLPAPTALGLPQATFFHAGFAFADFFQEGAYSAFVQMPDINDPGQGTGTPQWPAKLMFLRRNATGQWIDATAQLLDDHTGCITPRKSLVADFNRDGRPDVFMACHGYDGAPGAGKPKLAEPQRLLLSQADGRYANSPLPVVAYGHGGAAADLNGDGLPDVVLTNTTRQGTGDYDNPAAATDGLPFVLINQGNGQFAIDTTRLPAEWATRAIYSFELIDISDDGKVDLLVGATAPGATDDDLQAYPNSVFINDGSGRFATANSRVLPNRVAPSGRMYGIAGDFVYLGGSLYAAQWDASYTSQLVQRIALGDLSAQTVYENSAPLQDGLLGSQAYTFDWMYPATDGRMRAQMATCPVAPGPGSICSVSFPVP